jgi:hypothetical protein
MAVRVAALGGGGDGGGAGGGGGGGGGSLGPFSVSVEIKFIIVSSANMTPTWKLALGGRARQSTAGDRADHLPYFHQAP